MSRANPLWGAPRIHGELQKLGLEISQAAVSKYLGRRSTPPSQTWRTFLNNHLQTLVSVDFFVVPTVLFKVLVVFVVLAHERRRVLHINVTDTPTAQWTAQQLVEACPWETAPRYVLRDRDAVYGGAFSSRVQTMGIHEVKTAPRSPWQNPYVERLIGTLRRECLDHVVVLNETHLRRLLREYLIYYHGARTHLSLAKDTPEPRRVERLDEGQIVETPIWPTRGAFTSWARAWSRRATRGGNTPASATSGSSCASSRRRACPPSMSSTPPRPAPLSTCG
jgi:putative transposase